MNTKLTFKNGLTDFTPASQTDPLRQPLLCRASPKSMVFLDRYKNPSLTSGEKQTKQTQKTKYSTADPTFHKQLLHVILPLSQYKQN